jgi:hypothetical protein
VCPFLVLEGKLGPLAHGRSKRHIVSRAGLVEKQTGTARGQLDAIECLLAGRSAIFDCIISLTAFGADPYGTDLYACS